MSPPDEMSDTQSRPADSFGLWLLIAAVSIVAAALFSAYRVKPPIAFGVGFGLVAGLACRFLASALAVPRSRTVMVATVILAAAGFGLCFGASYRRAALEWQAALASAEPSDAVAAAILKNFPGSDPSELIAAQQRFTFTDYLSPRTPNWPSPWPEVLFGAEWILCGTVAGLCIAIRQSRERERPVAHASGSDEDPLP